MEQTNNSETDPPEIRKRLERIHGQRALIEDLATRLKIAQLECDRLETELSTYRASIAPIRKCPEEVLLMIFEASSLQEPRLLAGVIQVCKRWHDVAVNASRLWTHIHIKVESTWNQEKAARRDQALIRTCFKRSDPLPLHINLDLGHILDEKSRAFGFIRELRRVECENDVCDWARSYVYDDDIEERVRYMCESYGPDKILRTVSELVGVGGAHMNRWKTLHIILPQRRRVKETPKLWKLFSGPTPQLTKLHISGRLLESNTPTSAGSFPDLSSLEDLTIECIVNDLNFLQLTFPSVKRLDMQTNIHNSLQLSRFTNLEYLDILFQEESISNNRPLEVIQLPVLRDLTVHIYGSTEVEWHVPILQSLTIIGWIDNGSKKLPTVQALHVDWSIAQLHYLKEIETSLLQTVQAIISNYGGMEKFSIQIVLRPIWDKYVQGLSEEKRLALPMVTFDYC